MIASFVPLFACNIVNGMICILKRRNTDELENCCPIILLKALEALFLVNTIRNSYLLNVFQHEKQLALNTSICYQTCYCKNDKGRFIFVI